MGSVFVSYAREDQGFVRRLTDALTARGREAWVDWEGIAPTAEWMAEIRAAIDGSDAFLFVISPASAASQVCRIEVDHAVERGKRLLPIVHDEVDSRALPDAVRARNWIFLRDGDDFPGGVASLERALDTDLEWVGAHTRLTVRAAEWDRRDRDRSLLLRGGDLARAEGELAAGAAKEPAPTALQAEYVLTGRRAASRRGRGLVVTSVAVALVLALLGVVAVSQRDEAREQRDAALSRQLIASAKAELEGQPQRALLLAREAHAKDDTAATRSLLREAAFGVLERRTFSGHTRPTRGVAWTPDGRTVVSSSQDGTVRFWDVASGRGRVVRVSDGPLNRLAMAPDGRHVAVVGEQVHVVGVRDGRVRAARVASTLALAFSPDSRYLATAGVPGITVFAVDDPGRPLANARLDVSDLVDHLAFSPDGQFLSGGTRLGRVVSWPWRSDPRIGYVQARQSTANFGYSAWAFNRAGQGVAIGDSPASGRITVRVGADERTLTGHRSGVYDMVYAPDGSRLASGSVDASARIWDLAGSRDPVVLNGTEGALQAIAFTADGQRLATVGADSLVRVWDTAGAGRPLARGSFFGIRSGVSDDGQVAYAGKDFVLHIWSALGDGSDRTIDTGMRVLSADLSDDGRVVVASGQNRVWVGDAATGRQRMVVDLPGVAAAAGGYISPSGTHVAAVHGTASESVVRIYDVRTGRMVGERTVVGGVGEVAFRRGQNVVALASLDRNVYLWRWDRDDVQVRSGHNAGVSSVSFSPEGRWLATASDDATIRLWARGGRGPARVLRGHQGAASDLAWSDDGRWLASGGQDGTLRVWHVTDDGVEPGFVVYRVGAAGTKTVQWSSDRLFVVGADEVVRAVVCDVCVDDDALQELVEARTTRALTAEERATYLQGS